MSGFWRKILDKKANATHTPQPGDWAAMQSMLDKSPVLGKPAAGANGAAGSSSFIGGSTIIKGIVAVVVSLSAYTTYVLLNEEDSTVQDSYYYQARVDVEMNSQEMPISPENQDQDVASDRIRQQTSETGNVPVSSSGGDQSLPRSISAETDHRNEPKAVAVSRDLADAIATEDVKANPNLSDEEALSDESSQVMSTPEAENSDKGLDLADDNSAGSPQDSETLEVTGVSGSGTIQTSAENKIASEMVNPKATQDLSDTPHEEAGVSSEEPNFAEDLGKDLSVDMTDNDVASLDGEYEDEEEDESDVIVDVLKRMKFNSVEVGLSYSSVNSTSDYFAPGGAVELEWRLSHWRLQTGLAYHRWYESGRTDKQDISYIDTNYTFTTENREVTWVDSSWVVTGLNQGQYVYDTLSTVITDTITSLSFDTMNIYNEHPVPATLISSRFSVPIRISYRQRFGSFYGDLGAALVSNFTTYQPAYAGDAQKTSFSLDVAIRPALGYQINRKWGTELGFNYKIPVYQGIADEMTFDRSQYWSLSVGIRYFLD